MTGESQRVTVTFILIQGDQTYEILHILAHSDNDYKNVRCSQT